MFSYINLVYMASVYSNSRQQRGDCIQNQYTISYSLWFHIQAFGFFHINLKAKLLKFVFPPLRRMCNLVYDLMWGTLEYNSVFPSLCHFIKTRNMCMCSSKTLVHKVIQDASLKNASYIIEMRLTINTIQEKAIYETCFIFLSPVQKKRYSSHESLGVSIQTRKEKLLDEASKHVFICLSICNTVSSYSADACLSSQLLFSLKSINLKTSLGIFME